MTRFMTIAHTIIAMSITASGAVAGEKRPLAVEDLYRMETVENFTISPRGDEAVYVRGWYDVNFPGKRTALWRIDGETGRREPLEPGEPDGRMPVFSPDGKWLAFISDRKFSDGRTVVGAAPSYSDRPGGVWALERTDEFVSRYQGDTPLDYVPTYSHSALNDGFYGRIAFSPDAGQLLLTASAVGQPNLQDILSYWSNDQGEGYEGYNQCILHFYDCPSAKNILFDRKRTKPNQITEADFWWYGDPQWSRDGQFVICHVNASFDVESVRYSINRDFNLWKIARYLRSDGADLSMPLTKSPGPDVSPRISPDGKHVLYLSSPRKGPHADVFNLCVLMLDGDDAEERVLLNAHDADREADGTPPFQPTFPLRDDAWIDDEHVRVRGVRGMKAETMVFNIAGAEVPISADAKPEPAPHPNKKLVPPPINEWRRDRFEAREEIVKWKSFDGLEIEGVLTLPPEELTQFKQPYPVIVHPHGGPHSASKTGFGFTVHLFAAQGYAVFQPNFRGTYGYGRKFLDAARFDMGGSDMQDIFTGIDELIERGTVDKSRQFVYGISYGGYSTCQLITLEPERFRAACAQNAVTDLHAMWSLSDLQSWTEWEFGGKPWETVEVDGRKINVGELMRDRSPTTHVNKVKTPTLILHSDHDRRCPLAMGQMFYRGLKEAGCETELVIYKDERHAMWQVKHQADVLTRVLDWFAKHDVVAR